MVWLISWAQGRVLRVLAPYLVGFALMGLLWIAYTAYVASWEAEVGAAYKRGQSDQQAAQAASDAERFRQIIERYNDATSDPLSDCDAIRVLRDIAGPHAPTERGGEDCGPM